MANVDAKIEELIERVKRIEEKIDRIVKRFELEKPEKSEPGVYVQTREFKMPE